MFEKLKSWFGAGEKPITAGYNPGPSMLWWAYTNKRPPWNYYYADVMLLDPQVWFGVNIGNGPLLSAKVTVKPGPKLAARSDAAEIQEFIAQQWQRIWSTSAAQILRCKHYGFMAYEVVYKNVDGRFEFDYLRDFHPFDVGELKLSGGGRVGVRIHNIQRPGGGSVDLIGPKGLWITYDDEFCRTWGRALLQHAYAPWYDKNSDGGAFDLRRLRNFKDAWIGDLIRYPLKQIRTPNGQFVSGRDLAREIGENRASGAPIFLPSTRDQSGNYEWDYSPPQGVAGDSGIPQWIGDLDWDILDGLLVPREVVEASTTGSGFSGRSVPLVGFLSIRDLEFGGYVRQIKEQSLKPLARADYGADADDFDLVPTPLIETTGELMGGMGQPDSRHAGGDGAGQEGKGQEAGGVEQGSGFSVQGSGKTNDGLQFGQGSLWDEDEHPREDNGRFAANGSSNGKSRVSISEPKKRGKFENVKTKQKKLLEGMDALPTAHGEHLTIDSTQRAAMEAVPQETHRKLRGQFQSHPQEVKDALEHYRDSEGARGINRLLREEKGLEHWSQRQKATAANLSLGHRFGEKFDNPLTLWRGMLRTSPEKQAELVGNLKRAAETGQPYHEHAFTSWSLNPEVARDFASGVDENYRSRRGIVFKLRAKNGLYGDSGEHEFIHAPDVKYRVHDVDESHPKHTVIHVEQI